MSAVYYTGDRKMEDVLEMCIGLDVHKESIVGTKLEGSLGKKPAQETKVFGTLMSDLDKLREWVEESKCYYVAMESTGIYWQPVYERLEDCFNGNIKILVVNARHMKNVPGKKTDILDSEWIAKLLRSGLLNGSFIPDKSYREIRQLTRYRMSIVSDIVSQKNRIEKFLQSSGFRLSSFLSDIFGVSGRNIINVLIEKGFITWDELENCVKRSARKKMNGIMSSVNGTLSPHEQRFLFLLVTHLADIEKEKEIIELEIETIVDYFSRELDIICSIPGIQFISASSLLGEIGSDMSSFKTSEHLCSWAGVSPGNNKSAGKQKSSSTNPGNSYVKTILCEIAWGITRQRNTYLSDWYWKLRKRIGAKKAIIALARKILVILYSLLIKQEFFDPSRFENRRKVCEQKKINAWVRSLSSLGYHIEAPS